MNERSLPKGWMWTTLQKVCSPPQYGWTTKASPQGALHLLRTTDITADNLNWGQVPFCSEEPPDKEKYMLKTGDIVISRAGSIGSSYLVENPPSAVFASYLIRFRPLPVINEYYLAFFLKSSFYWNTISVQKTGSTLPNVNATKLKRIPVPLPPLPEQRAIAHVLGVIQEAKAARQRELELERERKAALMDHLFSYGTKSEPRKQTEIGEIPESWKVVQIGQIADFINGYSQFNSKSYVDNGIPIFRIGDLGGQVDLSGVKRVSKDIVPDLNQKRLFRGDILIAKIGKRVGASSAYNFDEPAILSSQVMGIRARRIEQKFLACFIESSLFYDTIKPHFFGSTRDNISPNQIGLTSIPLPSSSEQRAIAEVLQACDTKIAALEQETERLHELFHAMLDELMTGKRSTAPLIDAELPN